MCRTPNVLLLAVFLIISFASQRVSWSQVEPPRKDATKPSLAKPRSPAINGEYSKTARAAESDQIFVDMEAELKRQVNYLASTIGERNLRKHKALCQVADFVESELNRFGYQASRQRYKVRGWTVSTFRPKSKGLTRQMKL